MGKINTTKPSKHQDPIQFRSYPNKKLCIVDCLKEYIKRTENIRQNLESPRVWFCHTYIPTNQFALAHWYWKI